MSAQDVIAFAHKLDSNEALQNQVKALTPGDSTGLMKLASGLGFEFTTQELKTVLAQAGELNDDQLDQVVGGFGDGSVMPVLIGLLVPAVQGPPAINSFFRKAG